MSATTTFDPSLRTTFAWRNARKVLRAGHIGVVLSTVGIDLAALALPIFILQIYDRVLPNQTGTTLVVLILGLGIVFSVDLTLRVLRTRVASWSAGRLEHALRMGAVDALLSAPLQTFRGPAASNLIDGVGAISTLRDFEASKGVEIRVDLVFAALYLALIAYLGGSLALIPTFLLVIFGAAAFGMGRVLHDSFNARMACDQARQESLMKILRGLQTIKALALNQIILRRHEIFQERSARAVGRVMSQTAGAQALTVMFAQINTVMLLAFGAVRVLEGSMTIGAVAACTLLAGRAIQPIQTAIGTWTNYQSVRLARREVAGVLSLPNESSQTGDRLEFTGRITLDRVSFCHEGARVPVLDDVSLVLEPGRIIGIDGGPGSGKTTLLLLLLGLLKPQTGSVSVDGRDISEISREAFRRQTALLAREGSVFRGTVIDNLTNFREGECINEAMYVSFLLGADEPIRRLPAGFDQLIEATDTVPTGLRQRLAIIRALAVGPKLILFDEADVGLDHDSRTRLMNLIKNSSSSASVVLISPHADVLALADRRYRLGNGKLMPVATLTTVEARV